MANPNPNWNPNSPHGQPNPYGQGMPGQHPQGQPVRPPGWDYGHEVGPHVGAGVNEAQQRFMTKVFGWMTLGLGVTGVVAWYVFSSGLLWSIVPYIWPIFLVELAIVFGLSLGIRKMSAPVAMGAFLFYALLNGLTLSTIFAMYTMASIANVFFITTTTFGFMFVYGWTTKKDLTSMGSLAFMGLIGLIIASVVNVFFHNPMMTLIISCIGVLVFVGLTAWDAQKLKTMSAYGFTSEEAENKTSIIGALVLYLDFINLFIYLLRLLGNRR